MGGTEVVEISLDPTRPHRFVGPGHPLSCTFGELDEPPEVTRAHRLDAPDILELLPPVLPERLQQLIAAAVDHLDHRLVDQRHQHVDDIRRPLDALVGSQIADRFDRGQVEAAGKHRQLVEERPFARAQQLVGPSDGVAQRAVADVDGVRAGVEQVRPCAEPFDDGLRCKGAKTCGRQLQGEGEPIEPATELSDDGGVGVGEGETGRCGRRPLEQQLRGRRRRDAVGVGDVGRRHGEGGDRRHDLARQPQRRPGGGEHVDGVAAGADPFDQGDDRIEEVLAVVHQEQELAPRGEHGEHGVLDAEVLSLLDIQGRGDGLTEGGGVADGGQLHHRDAVVEVVAGRRQPPRQAGLADAARPHERDQTIGAHGPGQLRQLLVAPDQGTGIVSDRPAVGTTRRRWSRREECRVIGQDPCFQVA